MRVCDLQAQLGSLLARPMEDAAAKELAEAARARVDVLRSLLRTPAVFGDDEYERLLKEVFDATSKLLGREPTNHRGPESEEGWKVAGFQATAPDREFRGGGLLGLRADPAVADDLEPRERARGVARGGGAACEADSD